MRNSGTRVVSSWELWLYLSTFNRRVNQWTLCYKFAFQGEHRHMIACGNCHHKSMTLEPFTILSLSLPASRKCTLANVLENYYKQCSIDYMIVPSATKVESVSRIFFQRLPPILILHLNRFEYNILARKKAELCNFPPRQLSLGEHALSSVNLASYDLCYLKPSWNYEWRILYKLLQASSRRCLVPVWQ